MTTADMLVIAFASAAIVGSGMMAGLFFVFSNFVMKALASLPAEKGISAMKAINVVILNPWFFLLFFGTVVASLGVSILAITRWPGPEAPFLLAGGLLYLAGVFFVTMVCNVPRNNALAALDPHDPASKGAWRGYVRGWTAWNHVRTVGALAAMISLMTGLWIMGRSME